MLSHAVATLAALAVLGAGARPAQACAVCATGDTTMTGIAPDRPFAARLRLAGELRAGGAWVGASGYRVGPRVAARFGLSTRLDASSDVGGKADPNSGGFVGTVSSELVLDPATDVRVTLGAHVPALQALHGAQGERAVLAVGVAYDR